MSRRLALVGLLVLWRPRGSITHIAAGMAISSFFFFAQVSQTALSRVLLPSVCSRMAVEQAQGSQRQRRALTSTRDLRCAQVQAYPYKRTTDDILANVCSFLLLLTFLCMILFKVDTLAEADVLRRRMTDEQQDDFEINIPNISAFLGVCVFGSLVLTGTLCAIQLARERALELEMKRNHKARRLRYKEDGLEVQVVQVEADHYHTFRAFAREANRRAGSPPVLPLDGCGLVVICTLSGHSVTRVGHGTRSDAHRQGASAIDAARLASFSRRGRP